MFVAHGIIRSELKVYNFALELTMKHHQTCAKMDTRPTDMPESVLQHTLLKILNRLARFREGKGNETPWPLE